MLLLSVFVWRSTISNHHKSATTRAGVMETRAPTCGAPARWAFERARSRSVSSPGPVAAPRFRSEATMGASFAPAARSTICRLDTGGAQRWPSEGVGGRGERRHPLVGRRRPREGRFCAFVFICRLRMAATAPSTHLKQKHRHPSPASMSVRVLTAHSNGSVIVRVICLQINNIACWRNARRPGDYRSRRRLMIWPAERVVQIPTRLVATPSHSALTR